VFAPGAAALVVSHSASALLDNVALISRNRASSTWYASGQGPKRGATAKGRVPPWCRTGQSPRRDLRRQHRLDWPPDMPNELVATRSTSPRRSAIEATSRSASSTRSTCIRGRVGSTVCSRNCSPLRSFKPRRARPHAQRPTESARVHRNCNAPATDHEISHLPIAARRS
jgi:hypothetical protein